MKKLRSKTCEYSVVYWCEADWWEMSDWILWQIFPEIRNIFQFYITALIEMLRSANVNLNPVSPLSNHCEVQEKKQTRQQSDRTFTPYCHFLFQVGPLCLSPGLNNASQILPDDLVHCNKTEDKAPHQFLSTTPEL